MKKIMLLTTTILATLFVFSFANAAVTFKMTFVDDYNDDSVPTVNPGNNFTCYFWIDPGGVTIDGFSLCVSYPENKIVPTNLTKPFTDAGYISSPMEISNERTVVGSGDDKIDFSIVTFAGSGTGAIGKLATVEFQAITGLPESGEIKWCGIGSPDPDTSATTEYSAGGSPHTPDNLIDKSLPVQLSLFTADSTNNGIKLVWRTESEVNNLGFSIYRSEEKNGKYIKIGFVYGAGNSAMPNEYEFADKEAEAGKTYFYYLEDVDIAGERNKSEVIKVVVVLTTKPVMPIPSKFTLFQNFPNPFNPETWLPYQLAETVPVSIRIFDQKGRIIRTMYFGEQQAGSYTTKDKAAFWDGKNDFGEPVSSGTYFYQLEAGKFSAVRKMIIIK